MTRKLPIPIHVHAGAAPAPPAATHGHSHDLDPGAPIPGPAPVMLWVGDTPIDEAAIAREMQHHRSAAPEQARQEAARALVVQALLRREIERLGIEAEAQEGESTEEAAIAALIEREVALPQIDEATCRHWFDHNRERLHAPDRLRVRHILLAAAPADANARLAAREEGERLIAELRQHPERFTEFAQRHSACPSKDQGGELGWVERGDTTPEFERQLFTLKQGLAALTLESRYGHHVVCLDAIERGQPLTYEQARPRIAAYLETQVRQNALNQYLHILAERHGVRGLDDMAMAA